ncbi:unnamed protein product [Macrosiphum euphorbiae]|uniref:Uncharacterized protein n=1 Tax=Macrosiphum euphorbiae TaxID=13131 RepID=A0AAV0WHR5_9HEMI|nr:unnamed protein product [Macrosiphum euphorbiae]
MLKITIYRRLSTLSTSCVVNLMSPYRLVLVLFSVLLCCCDVLAKNVGLQHIKTIRNILLNTNENNGSMDIEFAPYKSILRPNRRTFKFENLQMYIVSNCFEDDCNEDE